MSTLESSTVDPTNSVSFTRASSREVQLRLRLEIPELLFVLDLIGSRVLPYLGANGDEYCSLGSFENMLFESARIRILPAQYAKLCSALRRCTDVFRESEGERRGECIHIATLAALCQSLNEVNSDSMKVGTSCRHQHSSSTAVRRILANTARLWPDILGRNGAALFDSKLFASCVRESGIALSPSDADATWKTLLRDAGVASTAGEALPTLNTEQLQHIFQAMATTSHTPSLDAVLRDEVSARLRKMVPDTLQRGTGRSAASLIFPSSSSSLDEHSRIDDSGKGDERRITLPLPWQDTESACATNIKERVYSHLADLSDAKFATIVRGLADPGSKSVSRSVLLHELLAAGMHLGKADAEKVWRQASEAAAGVSVGRRRAVPREDAVLTCDAFFAWLARDVEDRYQNIARDARAEVLLVPSASTSVAETDVEAEEADSAGRVAMPVIAEPLSMKNLLRTPPSPLPPSAHHRLKKSIVQRSDRSESVFALMSAPNVRSNNTEDVIAGGERRSNVAIDAELDNNAELRKNHVIARLCKLRPQMALGFRRLLSFAEAPSTSSSSGCGFVTCKSFCDELERLLGISPESREVVRRLVCDMACLGYDAASESKPIQFEQVTRFLDRVSNSSGLATRLHVHSDLNLDLDPELEFEAAVKKKLFECKDVQGQKLRLLSLSTILRQRLRKMCGGDADNCTLADLAKLLESVNLPLSPVEVKRIAERANLSHDSGHDKTALETSVRLSRFLSCLSGFLDSK